MSISASARGTWKLVMRGRAVNTEPAARATSGAGWIRLEWRGLEWRKCCEHALRGAARTVDRTQRTKPFAAEQAQQGSQVDLRRTCALRGGCDAAVASSAVHSGRALGSRSLESARFKRFLRERNTTETPLPAAWRR